MNVPHERHLNCQALLRNTLMLTPSDARFRDDGKDIFQFADEFLVVCPQCAQCARVSRLPKPEQRLLWAARLLCPSCGYNKDITGNGVGYKPGLDWYFHLPLWLGITCAGGQLWAFNGRHLLWLENYVRAILREQRRDPKWGWNNNSAVNRLPKWIKLAKNREDILHGIAKLKRKEY